MKEEIDHEFNEDFCREDVHSFFGLTYSNYFAMPRSVMQSMSADWQHKFFILMEEVEKSYGGYDMQYRVMAINDDGKFVSDHLRNYERGRRFVKPYTIEDRFKKLAENK